MEGPLSAGLAGEMIGEPQGLGAEQAGIHRLQLHGDLRAQIHAGERVALQAAMSRRQRMAAWISSGGEYDPHSPDMRIASPEHRL
jgi:hypothetical protein